MHWEFVIAGYGIVLPGIALYAYSIVRRGRKLAGRVPEERRRYLD
jgi:hypothetical protein